MTKLEENWKVIAEFITQYVKKYGEEILSKSELEAVLRENGVEINSWFLPSDICYNKTNKANLDKYATQVHALENVKRGKYRLLGEDYPYTGPVYWTNEEGESCIFGSWENGVFTRSLSTEKPAKTENKEVWLKKYECVKKLDNAKNIYLVKNIENNDLFI